MKITVYKDYNRTAYPTGEVTFVKLTDMSVDSLTQSFNFLENYKDSLFKGDISQIICETNNEQYYWWRLKIWRPIDDMIMVHNYDVGDIVFDIDHGFRDVTSTVIIKYNKKKDLFYYYYKGICDGEDVWYLQGASKSLVGALTDCMHSYGMTEKANKKEFNPRKGLKMKEYNKFQKCLWESYSTKMKSAEGYNNVSPKDIMIESIYSALKNTFNEDKIEELTDMLEGDE